MKTEIFATFGPACRTETVLKQMIQNGMTGMAMICRYGNFLVHKNI